VPRVGTRFKIAASAIDPGAFALIPHGVTRAMAARLEGELDRRSIWRAVHPSALSCTRKAERFTEKLLPRHADVIALGMRRETDRESLHVRAVIPNDASLISERRSSARSHSTPTMAP
jgi:hypothetical protein